MLSTGQQVLLSTHTQNNFNVNHATGIKISKNECSAFITSHLKFFLPDPIKFEFSEISKKETKNALAKLIARSSAGLYLRNAQIHFRLIYRILFLF